jgi:hypothetical protein
MQWVWRFAVHTLGVEFCRGKLDDLHNHAASLMHDVEAVTKRAQLPHIHKRA